MMQAGRGSWGATQSHRFTKSDRSMCVLWYMVCNRLQIVTVLLTNCDSLFIARPISEVDVLNAGYAPAAIIIIIQALRKMVANASALLTISCQRACKRHTFHCLGHPCTLLELAALVLVLGAVRATDRLIAQCAEASQGPATG
jgi:hypothetical protein